MPKVCRQKPAPSQPRVFIQRLGDGLQRRHEDDHGEAQILPYEKQDDGHAQLRALQPDDPRKAQPAEHAVDHAAVIEQQKPDQQHGRRGHQIRKQNAVSEERAVGAQPVQQRRDDEGQHPHQRRADQREDHGVLQAQQKHGVFPDIDIVGQPDEGILIAAVRQAVPYAPDEGDDVEQHQSRQSGSEKQPDRLLFVEQREPSLSRRTRAAFSARAARFGPEGSVALHLHHAHLFVDALKELAGVDLMAQTTAASAPRPRRWNPDTASCPEPRRDAPPRRDTSRSSPGRPAICPPRPARPALRALQILLEHLLVRVGRLIVPLLRVGEVFLSVLEVFLSIAVRDRLVQVG